MELVASLAEKHSFPQTVVQIARDGVRECNPAVRHQYPKDV